MTAEMLYRPKRQDNMEISKEITAATGLGPRRPVSLYQGSLKVPCLREECVSVRAIVCERWNGMKCRRDAGLSPTISPWPAGSKFGSILAANAPTMPGRCTGS